MKWTSVLLFAAAATAAPASWTQWSGKGRCLTDEQANYVVELSRTYQLKADLDAARAAGEFLYAVDDYRQYGDSINSLRGDPLGTLVEPDGRTYVENVLSAPPLAGIETLGIVHNCDTIVWHFRFLGVGGPQSRERVQGFTKITLDLSRDIQPVVRQDVEFNSIAWAVNTGFTVEPPTEGTYAPEG